MSEGDVKQGRRVVAVPVSEGGRLDPRWGKAGRIAVALMPDPQTIEEWREYAVGWDVAHDQGSEGSHHARVVSFLRDHAITTVVVNHMGPPMMRTLSAMGIEILPARSPDARESVLAALGGQG